MSTGFTTPGLVQLLLTLLVGGYVFYACYREPGRTPQFFWLGLLLGAGFFALLTKIDGVPAERIVAFQSGEFFVGLAPLALGSGFTAGAVFGWIGSLIRRNFRKLHAG